MISDYLNQTATWTAPATVNDYNEVATSVVKTIKCRLEPVRSLVRNAQQVSVGQNDFISASDVIYTESAIQQNHSINGRIVLKVEIMYDLDGAVLFYRGLLS